MSKQGTYSDIGPCTVNFVGRCKTWTPDWTVD